MMKTLLVTLAVAAAVARANPSQPLEESPRFGYLSLGSGDGALLQFNQTSVIQGILFSVVALVVAVVVLPFLGVDLSTIFEKKESLILIRMLRTSKGHTLRPTPRGRLRFCLP
ncbi:uncharacterized protein LOC122258527 [Penaeus japonicus]|uniref:uncharacterized protein LOC122258527 n=1 Tax=Penaeus japonicus TaxID=27405 RepID=UPI001C70F7BF|nr:uncharacterized protein LOC122258527 [Penaeus japonicus]